MHQMLVVVDYQKDFVDGALGFSGAKALDGGIAAKVRAYAAQGGTIVVTMDTHGGDYLDTREGKALPIPHCVEGTEGWALYGETAKALEEAEQAGGRVLRLTKSTFGCAPEDLAARLPKEAPETVELVGLVTNMCVVSNVCCFQARYPGAQLVVDGGLCASFDQALHEKTLDVLRGLQVQVT